MLKRREGVGGCEWDFNLEVWTEPPGARDSDGREPPAIVEFQFCVGPKLLQIGNKRAELSQLFPSPSHRPPHLDLFFLLLCLATTLCHTFLLYCSLFVKLPLQFMVHETFLIILSPIPLGKKKTTKSLICCLGVIFCKLFWKLSFKNIFLRVKT